MPNGEQNVVEQLILEDVLKVIRRYGETGDTVKAIRQLAEENSDEDVHYIDFTQVDDNQSTTWCGGVEGSADTISWNLVSREDFFDMAREEMARAEGIHGRFHSLHEAYAVLLEEVDELWDLVRLRTEERAHEEILDECIQIAAMAGRLIHNLYFERFYDNQPVVYRV